MSKNRIILDQTIILSSFNHILLGSCSLQSAQKVVIRLIASNPYVVGNAAHFRNISKCVVYPLSEDILGTIHVF